MGETTAMALDHAGVDYICTCVGAACDDPANACGVRVHKGTACTDVGALLWGGNVTSNVWSGANGAYYASAYGELAVTSTVTLSAWTGYLLADFKDKVLVVYD